MSCQRNSKFRINVSVLNEIPGVVVKGGALPAALAAAEAADGNPVLGLGRQRGQEAGLVGQEAGRPLGERIPGQAAESLGCNSIDIKDLG